MNRIRGRPQFLAAAGVAMIGGALAIGALQGPAWAFPVEQGSHGNLLVIHVMNTDPQLPVGAQMFPRDVPGFVARLVPQSQRTNPGLIMPSQTGEGLFVFDLDPAATLGAMGNAVIVLRRAEDDSLEVLVPLEVIAAELLDHDVKVVFRVDFTGAPPEPGTAVVALVDGSLSVPLADDGVPPDAAAGDLVYTGSHVFALGSRLRHRWLVTLNGSPECDPMLAGDLRLFLVHPMYDAGSNPELLPVVGIAACATVGVGPSAPPALTVLLQNAPNPFHRSTTLRFDLERAGQVSLQVYDVAGRRRRAFALGPLAPGRHLLVWDGRDDQGAALRPGTYFLRLLMDGRTAGTRRAVVIR